MPGWQQTEGYVRRIELATAGGTDMRDTAVGCWICTLPQVKTVGPRCNEVRASKTGQAILTSVKSGLTERDTEVEQDGEDCRFERIYEGRAQAGSLTCILGFYMCPLRT